MNQSAKGSSEESLYNDPRPVDSACDKFEELWTNGERPVIREFVDNAPQALRKLLFRELLSIEVEYRRASNDPPSRSQYKRDFPEYETVIDQVFEASVRGDGEPASTQDNDHRPTSRPPPDISELSQRYNIKELKGEGGMGWVYHARRKGLKMDVAIKVVAADYSKVRFQGEAETLVQLHSPHVVTVHDFEVLSNGTPVLVMEWVDGGDLAETMRANGGSLKEHLVLPWMRQTCEGMRAVAEQNIVHRDLKPSNIMITKDGVVKVADFGMARVPRRNQLSRDGQFMGTVPYISPEQASASQNVDQRSDIYSFGACFYHALTGVIPFEGDSDIDIIMKHASEPLVSPKARNSEISESTSHLLERCLAKSPDERFQSFDEVLNFLETTPWDRLEDDELSEFIALYQSRRSEYLERRRATDKADVYVLPNGRELRISVGNIAAKQVDAIVSSDDWMISMSDGVALDILRRAGPEIRRELECVPVRPGRAVVTSGGNLNARRIFHGVTFRMGPEQLRPSHDIISQVMDSCFYHADTHYVTSFAFPLLGTGGAGFSEESCLDTMFRFLARNLLHRATLVNQATIVLEPRLAAIIEEASDLAPIDRHFAHVRANLGKRDATLDTDAVAIGGYEFFRHYEQARYARSDLLVIANLPDGRSVFVIADVMGHGIGGSMVIDAISAEVKNLLRNGTSLVDTIRKLNHKTLELEETCRFATLVALLLDPRTHRITVVNAGHPPPLKRDVEGKISKEGIDNVDLPLGVQKDIDYQSHLVTLGKGESLTVAATGVFGAMNSSGEPYGESRLLKLISEQSGAQQIGLTVVDDVRQFQGDSPPITDWCLVCIRRST